MATQRLFLGNSTVEMEQVGNSISTKYSFWPDKKMLEVYWKGKIVAQFRAFPGQAFVVCCNGGIPEVNEIGIPYRKEDLVAWLLSYFKQARAYSPEGYFKLLKLRRKSFFWYDYSEWQTEGDNYIISLCYRKELKTVYHLACYISPDITKKEIIELFNSYGKGFQYPSAFVKELLKKRLSFTDDEIAQIKAL